MSDIDNRFKLFCYAGVIISHMGQPTLQQLFAFQSTAKRDKFLDKSNFNKALTLADIQDYCTHPDEYNDLVEGAIFECLNPI